MSKTSIPWASAERETAFLHWFATQEAPQQLQGATLRLASADASFRRYLRVDAAGGSRIIMDAPPAQENCAPFVQVAGLMQAAGLNVPQVLAWDQAQGFMLLSDLGSHTLMQVIDRENAQANLSLYLQAVDALVELGDASDSDRPTPRELVGGLYGVCIGGAFFGESMFSRATDASKTALSALVCFCRRQGITLIDCQQNTGHLASLGAREMARADFVAHLAQSTREAAPRWQFDTLYWQELLKPPPLSTAS